jgi:hypothetical protein
MRSAPSLLAAAVGISFFTSFSAAAARESQTVVVLELRSAIRGTYDTASLTERIRDIARRQNPDARVLPRQDQLVVPALACTYDCDVISAREQGGDFVATGEITNASPGYRVALTLRGVRSGQVLARSSATSSAAEGLGEAVNAAAADLFKGLPAPSSASVVAVEAASLPEVPALPVLPEGGAVNLNVDANVLVAYDHARNVEARGKDHPDDAAYAWEAVANADGENPYRQIAAERAAQWRAYADNKHSYESQLARDTSRLRKVLPLTSVQDSVKLELLTRYAKAYGSSRATTMLPYVPAGSLRDRAVMAMGCEGNDPSRCIALAKFAESNNDAGAAAEAWDRACNAGAYAACADSASRWMGSDPHRALASLDKGCGGGDSRSCVKAAKYYEEVKSDATTAAAFREKACDNGDGRSCRKLANAVDTGDSAADQKRAAELWRKGCAGGDNTSCVLARLANSQGSSSPRPSVSTPAEAPAPAQPAVTPVPAPAAPIKTSVEDTGTNRHPALGAALVGVGLVAAGGAFILATKGPDTAQLHSGHNWLQTTPATAGDHAKFIPILGATAVLSTITGLGILWMSNHDSKPKTGDVSVGVSPNAVTLQAKLP